MKPRTGVNGKRRKKTDPFLNVAPTSGSPTNTTSQSADCAKFVMPTVPTSPLTATHSCDFAYLAAWCRWRLGAVPGADIFSDGGLCERLTNTAHARKQFGATPRRRKHICPYRRFCESFKLEEQLELALCREHRQLRRLKPCQKPSVHLRRQERSQSLPSRRRLPLLQSAPPGRSRRSPRVPATRSSFQRTMRRTTCR